MKKAKICGIFFLFFVILDSFSYGLLSFFRQKQFDTQLSEDYDKNSQSLSILNRALNSKIDLCDKKNREQYLDDKLTIQLYEYIIFSEEHVKKKEYDIFIFRLFDLYGKKYSLQIINEILHVSSAGLYGTTNNILNEKFLKWIKDNNQDEDCWEKFLESEEYRDYLGEMKTTIETPPYNLTNWPEGKTIEEMYKDIKEKRNIKNLTIPNLIFNHHILNIEQSVAHKAFENYKQHLMEQNYMLAYLDSRIIFELWLNSSYIEKVDTIKFLLEAPRNLMPIAIMPSYLHIDLTLILIFSFITSLIITCIIFIRYK